MSDDLLRRVKVHGAVPGHIAIIMDGNGRWAKGRALPRPLGHHAGHAGGARGDSGLPRRRGGRAHAVRLQPGELAAAGGRDRRADEPARGVHRPGSREPAGEGRGGPHPRATSTAWRRAPGRRWTGSWPRPPAASELALNLCISYSARAEITRAARLLAEDVAAGRLDPAEIDEDAVSAPALHRPSGPTPICSSAPRARCGSPTSCSGSSPTPSCTSRPSSGPTSPGATCSKPSWNFSGATAGSGASNRSDGRQSGPPRRVRRRRDSPWRWPSSGTAGCRSPLLLAVAGALGARELFDLAERGQVRPLRALGMVSAAAVAPLVYADLVAAETSTRPGGGAPGPTLAALWLIALLVWTLAPARPPTRPLEAAAVTVLGRALHRRPARLPARHPARRLRAAELGRRRGWCSSRWWSPGWWTPRRCSAAAPWAGRSSPRP